ncbi:hypothetical protein SRABI128_04514 [Microbacterium sp. Bi128]|nr:hypothetical protein SRABI128_04514 [Microbacterium sp. Bi128]
MDVRQVELRAHGQFLDHELEVVVAGEGNHGLVRLAPDHAQRGGGGPAQRACLSGVDPFARAEHVQHLGAGDLRQSDGGHVRGVLAECFVHFLVHALRLDRHVVEVGLAVQCGFAPGTFVNPGGVVRQGPGVPAFPGQLQQPIQGGAGVGGDAEVRGEHAADLGRLDVDVHERAAGGVGVQAAGVAVGPAVADADHGVAAQEVLVAVPVAGLQAHHAGHEFVVIRDRAPAHQGGDHGDAQQLGQFHELGRGSGIDDAAAGHDERALACGEHVECLFQLLPAGPGLLHGQGLIGVDIEFDLGHLHVDRQVQQDRARPA